ncbi:MULTISPECIES: hypothetical protein [Winogradskyella]|uniref:hypothetical protein n=1 Tax=Winogradskyella TaxID=286104 RepID=UPI0015CBFB1D|nr:MULTISPECIES: hypothetical protein [Winogradskyella]QXP79824.1 hypothetical protein H0I32_04055 [Winogradskyella sp. HaHa_3_26]
MENKYYVHLNTNTLPHYLVDGIIRPASLIKNREHDFQNNSGNQIILSLKKWNKISDCSIEVVLNNDEDKALEQMSKDFFLCHTAIPISRIKAINFEDKEKADTVIWNINSTVAFIPKWSINYTDKEESDVAEEFPFTYITKKDQTKELTVTLKRFDRLLGGLAFLKVSAAINSENHINFSESYFSTLAYFNKRIASDIKKNNVVTDDRFHDIFKGDSRIFNYLAKQVNTALVEEVSKQERIQLKSKFGVIDLTSLPKDSLTFKLAILESFGKDSSKSVEDLINSLLSNLEEGISEEIALIYGLYVGYNALRNYYKIGNKKIQVKFDLNSKIDFYTVESIYQYAFHNKTISNDFDYLSINFLSSKTANKKDAKYKYIKVLSNYYPYKKVDYKLQKTNIIDALIKEVSKWFPAELFKLDNDKLSDKLNTLINPKLNGLIENVRSDSEALYQMNDEETPNISINKIDSEKEQSKSNEVKLNPAIDPIKSKNKEEYKEPLNEESDLFSGANKPNSEVEVEASLNEDTTSKHKVYDASELDKDFTIPTLKKLANDLQIKIPKGITKKGDIIKIILSNQE